jgi:hypothetical protein
MELEAYGAELGKRLAEEFAELLAPSSGRSDLSTSLY